MKVNEFVDIIIGYASRAFCIPPEILTLVFDSPGGYINIDFEIMVAEAFQRHYVQAGPWASLLVMEGKG